MDDQASKSKANKYEEEEEEEVPRKVNQANNKANAVGTNLATNLNLVEGKKKERTRSGRSMLFATSKSIDPSVSAKKRRPLSQKKKKQRLALC
jgi:hypothetical protein